jgi:hypothetical protein
MPAHVPERLMRMGNKATVIDPVLLPHPQHAVDQYRRNGGRISDPEQDIKDPLFDDPLKSGLRSEIFNKKFPSVNSIFHNIVSGNGEVFINALKLFIDVTFRLYHS